MTRLIVVSNRGPVTYERDDHGDRIARRGGGGLATALRGLLELAEVTWIASATTQEDRAVAAEGGADDGVVLLAHDPDAYDRYYNVIANPLLWFTQHALWGLAEQPNIDRRAHEAWDEGYVTVNQAFADAVVAELDNDPEALVLFHDYQLYLAPRYVRRARPDAVLAHFVHVPWPADWSVLPREWRSAIRDGLLANDVVSFHTQRWADNFCAGGPTGRTTVTHHAISIDTDEFRELRDAPAVRAHESELEAVRPEKLVVRVERTEPSKNTVRGIRAFGLLLDEHPEWRERVSMLVLLDPSRQEIAEYAAYREAAERAAAELNERLGRAAWTPVDLRVGDDFDRSIAAYKQYDVLFVNPVFDGLNLIAKEGPIVNERCGVVILSENAGAYEELADWVLGVNPFDLAGQADALHHALAMDDAERAKRATGICDQVRAHDVSAWLAALLADVERVSRNVPS
jgi:trehalose 6-phosphate synthase